MISAQKVAGSAGSSDRSAPAEIVGLLFCRRYPDELLPALMSWSTVAPESTEYLARMCLSADAVIRFGHRACRFRRWLIQAALHRPAAGS